MTVMAAAENALPAKPRPALTFGLAFLLFAVGGALGVAGWYVSIRPKLRVDRMRYESVLDIAKLYGLQLSYKKAHGVYADGLDALLSEAPDRDALKKNLAANVDMDTLAVVGGPAKFKIELNVLDPDRTPIRVRGPIQPRRAPGAPVFLPEQAPPMNADGAPLASGH